MPECLECFFLMLILYMQLIYFKYWHKIFFHGIPNSNVHRYVQLTKKHQIVKVVFRTFCYYTTNYLFIN